MVDLYLQAMMRGEFAKKKSEGTIYKDKFDIAIDKEIDSYINEITANDDPREYLLVSPKMKHAQLVEELKEMAKFRDLNTQIELALMNLRKNGGYYLEASSFSKMENEFLEAEKRLDELDPLDAISQDLQQLLGFSEETLFAIAEVARMKFSEGQYYDSFAIFILLATLDEENPDFWLRAGIAAQKCDYDELALKSYAIALSFDPELIEARLFSSKCYLKCGDLEGAKLEYLEAKKIGDKTSPEQVWSDLMASIGGIIGE